MRRAAPLSASSSADPFGDLNVTPTYVCPDCKTPLKAFYGSDCEYEFPRLGEIPRLLSRDRGFAQTEQVAAAYDAIYADRSKRMRKQGRTPEFIAYFSALVDRLPTRDRLRSAMAKGSCSQPATAARNLLSIC